MKVGFIIKQYGTLPSTLTFSCVRVQMRQCLAVGCLFQFFFVNLERSKDNIVFITPPGNKIFFFTISLSFSVALSCREAGWWSLVTVDVVSALVAMEMYGEVM